MTKERLYFLKVSDMSIMEQLHLEERLLRGTDKNWCLVNEGVPPAIVMGISGKVDLLIDKERVRENPIPIIRRFSGGGTVVVDSNTCFVTFICNSAATGVDPFPEKVHRWAEALYKSVFPGEEFALRENDYVFAERKFGGNAQYMQRGRWLHHTSFLWNYEPEKMKYLLMPPKTPSYREGRGHEEFLCRLEEKIESKALFFEKIQQALSSSFSLEEVASPLSFLEGAPSHRISTESILL